MERAAIEGEEARGVSLLLERRHEAHEVFEGLAVLLRGALALQAPASRLFDVPDFSSAFRLSAISNFNIWKIETLKTFCVKPRKVRRYNHNGNQRVQFKSA